MMNRTLQRKMFRTGAALTGLAVILGAFGAHGLRNIASPAEIETFKTGVQYQFIHAPVLFIMALSLRRIKEKTAKTVFVLFNIGMLIFCGSLYILGLRSVFANGEQLHWIGAITPIGGLSFIAGWFYLALYGYKPVEHLHHEDHSHFSR